MSPLWRFHQLGVLAALVLLATSSRATIVGLNQIVTPEIQPEGVLGISAQAEHSFIGNSQQVQFELGLTPRFEVGWFQGLEPGEAIFASELNLLQTGPHLLTTGFINWSTRGTDPQPVLEYGYYHDKDRIVVGAIYANPHSQLLLGYKRILTDKLQFSTDFQSGSANSATIGITWNITPDVSLNPALYRTNTHPHHLLGYAVLTWNLALWK